MMMTNLKKTGSTKCFQYRANGTHITGEIVKGCNQPGKACQSLYVKCTLSTQPSIPVFAVDPGVESIFPHQDLYSHAHSSFIFNDLKQNNLLASQQMNR